MDCSSCGQGNLEGAKFCRRCGTPLSSDVSCSTCGARNLPDSAFCTECGQPIARRSEATTAPPAPAPRETHPRAFVGGRYEVQRFLGEGGKKRVYLAHDALLDRDVAFALIKTEGLDEAGRLRVRREAQAMGRLGSHPNIVSVLDLGEYDEQLYLVTELMTGGDLRSVIDHAPEHRLPFGEIVRLTSEVCQALEHAHEQGIVHRDIKPGNVWLSATGASKLGDFGLALAMEESRLTLPGLMVGTVTYMAPEQAIGGTVTRLSDLYALGAMLYEMVCGRPPFVSEDISDVIKQHLNVQPVAPSRYRPEVPPALEALILGLLSKDPQERPRTAAAVRAALEAIDTPPGTRSGAADGSGHTGPSGSVFVGREREMGVLKAALEDALHGRGKLVALVGEPGIGKTRTAQELAAYAVQRRAQALWGRCYPGQGAPPYWPWVQAIRSYIQVHAPIELRAAMGAGAGDIAEIVTEVQERLPDVNIPPTLEPAQARFRLFDSITAFFKNAARVEPIVLILGNLHWADKPSLLLLEHLSRELEDAHLLVIGTYRDTDLSRRHPLAQMLSQVAGASSFQRLRLQGLNAVEVSRFIERTAGVEPPAGLVAAVHGRTDGNPLFVAEVVQLLAELGELRSVRGRKDESWTSKIPEGVREVIGQRLDRLSKRCNQMLTIASVIGREFRQDQLLPLVDHAGGEHIAASIEEALAAGVIQPVAPGVGRFAFTNALLHQTLSSELSRVQRTRLHARIAEAFEASRGHGGDVRVDELAYHFAEAATVLGTEKLVRYSLLAGERALETYAYEDAVDMFERALAAKEGQPPDSETAALHFGLGRAQAILGLQDTAAANLTSAFDYYAGTGDRSRAVAVAEHPVPHLPGQVQGATSLITRALGMVPPDSLEAGRLLSLYGMTVGIDEGDYAVAHEASERALAIARREHDDALELLTLARASSVDGYHLRAQEGLEKSLRAIELSQRLNDPLSEASSRFYAALALWSTGEIDRARVHATSCLALAERLRDRFWLASALWANEIVYRLKGDFRTACDFNDRGLALLPNDPRLLGTRGLMDFEMGNVEQGAAHVEQLLAVMRRTPPGPTFEHAFVASIVPPIARISGRTDWLDAAERAAEITLSFPTVTPLVAIRARTGRSWMAIVRGDAEAAAERYAEHEHLRGRMTPGGMFSVDHILGLLAITQGKFEVASDHFEDALTLCRGAGYRPELAWVACDYGAALIQRGTAADRERASRLLDEALATARELGMPPLMEHARRHREALDQQTGSHGAARAGSARSTASSMEGVAWSVIAERPDLRTHVAPDGTVTILFSDIEGYSAMTARLGDASCQALLHIHNRAVREQIAAHGGFEVKTQGDSFMVAFASARRALQCAVAVQRSIAAEPRLANEGIRVRIGLHTGEAIKEGEDFFGTSVIQAARIAGRAQGGQILVSELLRGLVGSLADVELRDAGRKQLKGLPGRQRVYRVVWDESR